MDAATIALMVITAVLLPVVGFLGAFILKNQVARTDRAHDKRELEIATLRRELQAETAAIREDIKHLVGGISSLKATVDGWIQHRTITQQAAPVTISPMAGLLDALTVLEKMKSVGLLRLA